MTTPTWTAADSEMDISDVWVEEMDTENEDGAIVTAYFLESTMDPYRTLRGISIEEDGHTVYRDREWFINVIGADVLWRLEEVENAE